ncbi:MAG: site-specific integrase [Bacteroidota bacterium]
MQITCKWIFEWGDAMKTTSIKISLDKRRIKDDGTYPIILRLTHNGQSTSIKTGFYVPESDWDDKACKVKSSYRDVINVTRLNNDIQKKKAEALDEILKFENGKKNTYVTIEQVRNQVVPGNVSTSFYDFTGGLVKNLIASDRIGTSRSYIGVVNILKTFNKRKPFEKNKGGNPKKSTNARYSAQFKEVNYRDLDFEEISYEFLKKFESYHLSCGNGYNGLSVYMRGICSIYNQAIKEGKVERKLYPFNDYKIKNTPTQKRALDLEYLKRIVALELEPGHVCFDARNYFLASYLMYGMNFADMARLEKKDIAHGRIQYRRRKTAKLYDIKVTENLDRILSFYMDQNNNFVYVFPIIKRDKEVEIEKDVQWARKPFNKNLKTIAGMTGIEQKLTNYVSRHSFATHALHTDIPVNAISAMLGHSSIKTTEIYLKSLPTNVLDEYNKKIANAGLFIK